MRSLETLRPSLVVAALAIAACSGSPNGSAGAAAATSGASVTGPNFIEANGLTFGYLEAGQGPLVLCLHGFPDTAHTWDDLLPRLATAGYHAVAPFMRGYDPTSIPQDGNYSMVLLGEDVLALIDAFGASDAVVIGHDWGALAAYTAADKAPSRVSKLVTVAIPQPSVLGVDLGPHFFLLPLPGSEAVLSADNFQGVKDIIKHWAPDWTPTAEELQPVLEDFSEPGRLSAAIGYYRSLVKDGAEFLSAEGKEFRASNARKTSVPTLSLYGADDGAVDPALWNRAANGFTGPYNQVKFDHVGHFVQDETPDAFAAAVLTFLGPPPLAASGAGSSDAKAGATRDSVCAGAADGSYCGGDQISGDPGTLYTCVGGGVSGSQVCDNGCGLGSGGAGAGDSCGDATVDVCAGVPDGSYCGGDQVSGDPGTLYMCAGGALSGSKACNPDTGCQVNAGDAGTGDSCN